MIYYIVAIPMTAIAINDYRTRRIPDPLIFLVFLCGAMNVAAGGISFPAAFVGCGLIGSALLLFALCTDGVGGGDIKLCAALGFLFGPLVCLMLLSAALLTMLIFGRIKHAKSLPFAPFLLFAYMLTTMIRR